MSISVIYGQFQHENVSVYEKNDERSYLRISFVNKKKRKIDVNVIQIPNLWLGALDSGASPLSPQCLKIYFLFLAVTQGYFRKLKYTIIAVKFFIFNLFKRHLSEVSFVFRFASLFALSISVVFTPHTASINQHCSHVIRTLIKVDGNKVRMKWQSFINEKCVL